ncbi:MAG: FAD-binding and (Fe-S)-binding domain-containing protein [Cytophagales bacterium]
MLQELERILPKSRIKARLIDLLGYGSDAGFYKLTPKAVVMPESVAEIQALFQFSHQNNIPITFRTGGTSLSGQAITDGILVELSQYWRKIWVENEGKQIRVQPGVIGAIANAHLKRYKTKIGPDPSSISSAMMGGILSNNSSGMCCGVHFNAYHTLKYISFVLPDGIFFNTEIKEDYYRFEQNKIAIGIQLLRDKILTDNALLSKIRKKYKTKNTVGYGLNAFVDYSHPLDIFAHLLVGGEGTLAFISEAVLDTIPDFTFKATSLLYFNDIAKACEATIPIKESGAIAIELMDRASLRSIENIKGVPDDLKFLPPSAAALLIEYQANDIETLNASIEKFYSLGIETLNKIAFTKNALEQALLWKVRKGMFPSVGAIRAQGTSVILEDIAFPIERMAAAIADLQLLFTKYRYENAIIFGHAKDGNIHFVITQTFNNPQQIDRYDRFMNEVIDLVVNKYEGALKAEHGTGRNMAPFVETEWGGTAYQIMTELKALVDPHNLLNPGVIINSDAKAHIKNLKKMPAVEQEVDKCIECGACEPKCPSKDLTLSPRRRIVVRREMELLKASHQNGKLRELVKDFEYSGIETCAVDGMCAIDCPVDINTGDLIKRLRAENHSETANRIALLIAKNFKLAELCINFALKTGELCNHFFGKNTMHNISSLLRKLFHFFPLWNKQLASNTSISTIYTDNIADVNPENPTFIYYSACLSRMMGSPQKEKKSIQQTFIDVTKKAGVNLFVPQNIQNACCGQAFISKGYLSAYEHTVNETISSLWQSSQEGKLAIVLDLSSCTQTLHACRPYLTVENQAKFDKLLIFDSVDFLHDTILPLLKNKVINKKTKIALHPVCSLGKLGLNQKFKSIAEACAEEVTIPINAGCCGMAGDRGFLVPELTHSATKVEISELENKKYNGYYSSAKTCEMAMTESSGKNYQSIVYLIDEVLP